MTFKCSVFLSSTCYDMPDLRKELRQYLEENGFVVSLSEDPYSAFYVDPTDDSIGSCLANVERCDAVVCVIDRRYGGLLKKGNCAGMSATHAEVRHAWHCKKPVLHFIRKVAWDEFQQLCQNPTYSTKWVEPDDTAHREHWLSFVKEICKHDPEKERSNWRDLFEFSLDLRPLVLKRLLDHFPAHLGAVAMLPDRLVRLHFVFRKGAKDGKVWGHFRNVGVGPALNLLHGYRIGPQDSFVRSRGALGEKESILAEDNKDFCYEMPLGENIAPVLFCEYDNRFGDRYRVEVPMFFTAKGYEPSGGDKFSALPPLQNG